MNYFAGVFKANKRKGKGTLYYNNNCYFEGTFNDLYIDGVGTYVDSEGNEYEEVWDNGKFLKREKKGNNRTPSNSKSNENPLYGWLRKCKLNNSNLSID